MSVSVISVYRIGYRYRLILLLNIGYRNNRLIWILVQHYIHLAMLVLTIDQTKPDQT